MVLKNTSGNPLMHTKAHPNPFLVPTVQKCQQSYQTAVKQTKAENWRK